MNQPHIVGKNPNGFKWISMLFLAGAILFPLALFFNNIPFDVNHLLLLLLMVIASLVSMNTYLIFKLAWEQKAKPWRW